MIAGEEQTGLWVAPPNTTVSRLSIARTELADSGNYTCAPQNMVQDTVTLSISKGEHGKLNILQTFASHLSPRAL